VYFAHKDFLFSIVGKCEGGYVAEKEDGYTFKIPKDALKKYYKPVKKLNKEEMVKAYQEMGLINLEEANASVHTYNDGMEFYK
jgi:hypothetical protein